MFENSQKAIISYTFVDGYFDQKSLSLSLAWSHVHMSVFKKGGTPEGAPAAPGPPRTPARTYHCSPL